MNPLSLYETMSEISGCMVRAARDNDWDRLVALEQDAAHLRDMLAAINPLPSAARLSEADRARKLQLIRRILADDAQVRSYTEPWMESARKFLGGTSASRNLRQAYGI